MSEIMSLERRLGVCFQSLQDREAELWRCRVTGQPDDVWVGLAQRSRRNVEEVLGELFDHGVPYVQVWSRGCMFPHTSEPRCWLIRNCISMETRERWFVEIKFVHSLGEAH